MTCERPAILSHASNAELVASYTQPQPGQPEKVLVSSSGTSHQVSSQVICAQKIIKFCFSGSLVVTKAIISGPFGLALTIRSSMLTQTTRSGSKWAIIPVARLNGFCPTQSPILLTNFTTSMYTLKLGACVDHIL